MAPWNPYANPLGQAAQREGDTYGRKGRFWSERGFRVAQPQDQLRASLCPRGGWGQKDLKV